MKHRRRRTDHLPSAEELPADPVARARVACEALTLSGFDAAIGLHIPDGSESAITFASSGRFDRLMHDVVQLAEEAARTGMPLYMPADRALRGMKCAVITGGDTANGRTMLVVADTALSQREGEALAAWLAPVASSRAVLGGSCGQLAASLAAEFSVEAVVISLFASAGMLCNLHVRSGGLLRTWRLPTDTVWGEAAQHGAAFVLGDLHAHPGTEALAALGMSSAAIVGLENGNGQPIGSIGVASRDELDMDIARMLLERAPILGPQIMQLRSTTRPIAPLDVGLAETGEAVVELRGFAQRVGCRRFAMYERKGTSLRLVAAHAGDGTRLISPPDPYEEQLVCWASDKGIAIVSEDAAAILVGTDTVLYAQDPRQRPIDCLRRALGDLRDAGFPQADAA
ncbi:MAG: hypothetical protein H7123_06220 [Thermoleophilia bacterium]|nr:hypothetical protein [Thermoleophilia bacterium]